MESINPTPSGTTALEARELPALIQKLLSGEVSFLQLTQAQKDFVRTVEHKCSAPGCEKRFPLYDPRQGKIRQTCSRKCQGIIRRSPNRQWECVLCGRRFKYDVPLKRHIEALHKDYTLHQYLEVYLKANGRDPASLTQYCPHCGRRRRLNFAKGRYDNCWCENSTRKIKQLEELLSKTTDEIIRKKIKRQIIGCRSVLSRKQNKGKSKIVKTQSTRPVALPASPPVKSLIKVDKDFDFNGFANYFDGIIAFASVVFDAFYNLVREVRSGASPDSIKRANTALHEQLQTQGWLTTLPERTGYWAFVYLISPETSDYSLPTEMMPYFKELLGDQSRITNGFSKLSFDHNAVSQFLHEQQHKLPYVVTKLAEHQAFYRIIETHIHHKPTLCFNPRILYQLDLWYRKT